MGFTYNGATGLAGAGAGAATGALAGASIGSTVPGIGTAIGAGAGALIGGIGGSFAGLGSSSADSMSMQDAYNLQMFNIMKDLYMMDQQNKYNQSNMRLQKDLQTALNNEQFEQNKYFIENAYQMTVDDMKKAGINPMLAAGNANVGSVGSGSAAALGTSLSNTSGTGVSDLMTAQANSAQAHVAKNQLALNVANSLSDIGLKYASSAKAGAEAKSAESQARLNDVTSNLKVQETIREYIKNSFLPEREKKELEQIQSITDYNNIRGALEQELAPYQQRLYSAEAYNQFEQGRSQQSIRDLNVSNKKILDLNYDKGKMEYDFYKDHPGVYGTGKTLESLGNAIGVIGGVGMASMLRSGGGRIPMSPNPNVKSVIFTPPKSTFYERY